MTTEHRLLMTFRSKLAPGAKLNASLEAADGDYLSISDGMGSSVTVTIRLMPRMLIVNQHTAGTPGEFLHQHLDAVHQPLPLEIAFAKDDAKVSVPGAPPLNCAFSFDLSGLRYAMGKGAWQRLEIAYG